MRRQQIRQGQAEIYIKHTAISVHFTTQGKRIRQTTSKTTVSEVIYCVFIMIYTIFIAMQTITNRDNAMRKCKTKPTCIK